MSNEQQELVNSDYVSQVAPKSLRVVCYGSSSSKTPEKYLTEARALGYILACRGHICVNGAGSFGCMAATNAGAASGNGHIVGVIHEMWVVDGSDWDAQDAGAHDVFQNPAERDGPIRELIVAGGDDLQERKKLLVKDADSLIVLPGGPGTWDEVRACIMLYC
jgi:predicted Rossmann-fold nucleotide-binding protein